MSEEHSLPALLALRKCVLDGIQIEEVDDKIKLGEEIFPKDILTAWKSSDGVFMSLQVLVLFMKYTTDGRADIKAYTNAYRQAGIGHVKFKEQKPLSDFLTGNVKWSKQIEDQTPQDEPVESEKKSKSKTTTSKPLPDEQPEQDDQNDTIKMETLMKILKNRECSHYDRNSVLLSSHRFGEALRLDREAKKQKTELAQKEALKAVGEIVRTSSVTKGPIIVVPASATATVSMYNVKKFLDEGIFQHTSDIRAVTPEKPDAVYVEKNMGEYGVVRFKVVDSVKKFRPEDWDRVAAVFALGPAWQFKDWKVWRSEPAVIFANTCGIHLYFDDAKLAPHLKTWNVLLCPLKKQTRSQDGIEQHRIWGAIQKFLIARKIEVLKAGVTKRS